ncbi:MAG: hypothetical protein AAB215_07875 [Planctomycetota bacterium]
MLPIAREVDGAARARRCEPRHGRFVSPKRLWLEHVTVLVRSHCVDALTGPDGEEEKSYLNNPAHWEYPDNLLWSDVPDDQLEVA